MTDKEKREVKAGVISIFKRFNILDHAASLGGLRDDILRYIDSLQEEPKPKFNKGDKIQSVGKSTGHIYTFTIKEIQDDCYVLDDDKVLTFNMQDNWELVEGPVSEDLEQALDTFLATYFGSEKEKQEWPFLKKMAIHFVMWQRQKDSELPKIWPRNTIDEYAYQIAYDLSNDWKKETATWDDVERACKLGSEWQKQQDEHLIWQLSSANYEKGIEEGKKQMMKDAFEREVKVDAGGYPYIPQMELYDYDKDVPLAKEGDKYKVIIIKED